MQTGSGASQPKQARSESQRSSVAFPFTLVMNPGRSGSSFLRDTLRTTVAAEVEAGAGSSGGGPVKAVVEHEQMHADVTRPRLYSRAYDRARQDEILADPLIARQLDIWERQLEGAPVVELGWTANGLAPVLKRRFGDRFRAIILHRHPVQFAASRAVMGNYQGAYTTSSHEMAPTDPHALFPQFESRWSQMTPFEKCLYWWLEFTTMALEFKEKSPETPMLTVASASIFQGPDRAREIAEFAGLDAARISTSAAYHNSIQSMHREAYPLGETWRRYRLHPEVVTLGEALGYGFNDDDLAPKMAKYQVPSGVASRLRRLIQYHQLKRGCRRSLDRVLGRSENSD